MPFLAINSVETGFNTVSKQFRNSAIREMVYTLFLNCLETGFKLVYTVFNRNGMPVSDMPFPNFKQFRNSVKTGFNTVSKLFKVRNVRKWHRCRTQHQTVCKPVFTLFSNCFETVCKVSLSGWAAEPPNRTLFSECFQTVSYTVFKLFQNRVLPILAWTEVDWKQCRNRFLHCLKFGSGSWDLTLSESGNRNSLMLGSDTLCAMCHFLTCRFWHVPVLACQFLTPTGFYTVFKLFMPVLAHQPVLTLVPN